MPDPNTALLPTGFHDILPPDASARAHIVAKLMEVFERYGYDLISSPFIEFEETLFTGAGKALEHQTFRVLDPVSRKMMGLRADITMQVARIAMTRLKAEPRPLRLSYSGEVLQVKGADLYGERQATQAGIELIGASSIQADAEVMLIAAQALERLGLEDISLDLNLPQLSSHLLETLALGQDEKHQLRMALNKKDFAAIAALGGKHGELLTELVSPYGSVEKALAHLASLKLPPEGARLCSQLKEIVALIQQANPHLHITIDPLEHRGFEYHTGVSFAFFSRRVMGELARGGRYTIQTTEAVGVTLYVNDIFRLLSPPSPKRRVYLPAGTAYHEAESLQKQGFVTLFGLESGDDVAEAKRQHCGFVFKAGRAEAIA